ncbi:helix-turn-helix domain-containing protein [Bacillus toyonensis]|uniref:Excisionase n=1 Tax=Bacillus toyonensis TaxID=155322 RepID=A0A2A8GZJ2_9BACI|nr:helix-turn-helix domain-containing protein [Bacillus toyonensis]PEP85321.1 excisionase [Bacillus toyonensis]
MEKITLTVKEVAELLDVSLTTVYSMTRMNEIPHARIRGKILFHRSTVETWLIHGGMQNYEKSRSVTK